MVSLSRSFNTNSGGATFFAESDNMDDQQVLQPILESYGVFKPLNTVPAFSLQLFMTFVLEIIAVVFAILHPDPNARCREYFILIYIHVGLWFLTLVVDQIARIKHYNLRMNGYLDFYKKTQVHHKLPIYVVSLWNTVLLLIQALMQHFYPDNFAEKCLSGAVLSPVSYICAFVTVEFCILCGININYILRVRKFNKMRPPPDVQKEEWNACSTSGNFAGGEVGFRQVGDRAYDFIEKQADMIRHLKDHNAKLGEKLMILNAQLQQRARNPTPNPN